MSRMASLLQGKPATFQNKLNAVLTPGCNQRFFQDKKAGIYHPEMNTYKKIFNRVRAVRGFHHWPLFHSQIVEEVSFQLV
jgi:hypothetical protein